MDDRLDDRLGDRLRVLQVLGSSAGGVARHVAQIAQGLVGRGTHVVVAGPESLLDEVTPDGSRSVAVDVTDRPSASDLGTVRQLRALAAGADVVHAHGLRAGALVVLATRGLSRPRVVVTLHNLPVGGRGVRAVAAVLERVVARGADVVLGVSGDLVGRATARGASAAERALVPAPARRAAAPAEVTRASLGGLGDRPLLVTVARLAPQKGLDLLCETAALLAVGPEELRPVWLLAGDGPLENEIRRRVREAALPVRVLGRREDVADLLGAADVVVSTARWEGQPLGIQEALALGAAVVATDVGGTAEVTAAAARLVPTDPAALARAVRELLADDGARTALRRAARERAAQLPDLAATLDQLLRVYSTGPGGASPACATAVVG